MRQEFLDVLPRIDQFHDVGVEFFDPVCPGEAHVPTPELEHLYPDFKEKGIELVGLSIDLDVETAYVGEYAADLGVSYPLYMADEESVSRIFGQEVFVPFSILVDEKGRVTDVFEGWSARSQRRIGELLDGP